MATATGTKSTATKRIVRKVTKSDKARTMFASGSTITEVATSLKMNYAFAYGVAKRAGFAATAATRRSTKAVAVVGNEVTIQIVNESGEFTGTVRVDMTTGKVTRKTSK